MKLAYPYNRPGPARPDLRQSDVSLGFNVRQFNFACRGVEELRKVDWTGIKGLGRSENGRCGVIFVETEEGGCVVKAPIDPVGEYFGYLLLKKLRIAVPPLLVISHTHPSFPVINSNLLRSSFLDQALHSTISKKLNSPFFFLMEYVPGFTLLDHRLRKSIDSHTELQRKQSREQSVDFSIERSMDNFTETFSKPSLKTVSLIFDPNLPVARHRLLRLGMIVASDWLIGNRDRVEPEGEGNGGNLILSLETKYTSKNEDLEDVWRSGLNFGEFFAIDSKVFWISKNDRLAVESMIRRFKMFEDFLESLFGDLNRVKRADIDPRYPWEKEEVKYEDEGEGEEERMKRTSNYLFIYFLKRE